MVREPFEKVVSDPISAWGADRSGKSSLTLFWQSEYFVGNQGGCCRGELVAFFLGVRIAFLGFR